MDKLTGKKIIIFGAGLLGKKALIYFGSRSVKCFADNNKAGEFYCGKHVISFDELCKIHKDYDVVVAMSLSYHAVITTQLLNAGIDFAFFRDLQTPDDFESNPRLAQFKDKHKGEKCFIIGNGPSLKAEDLDVLHKNNIVSFGSNRIYKIFDNTAWRPDYLVVTDHCVIRADFDTFINLELPHIFIADTGERAPEPKMPYNNSNDNVFHFESLTKSIKNIQFFYDPSKYICTGYTVTYAIFQWAAYMGFTEMYLLGVDNSFSTNPRHIKADKDSDHFCADYADTNLAKNIYPINFEPEHLCENMTNSYKIAEAYSRSHGFRIYNATRGGKLEVFERVDFDKMF